MSKSGMGVSTGIPRDTTPWDAWDWDSPGRKISGTVKSQTFGQLKITNRNLRFIVSLYNQNHGTVSWDSSLMKLKNKNRWDSELWHPRPWDKNSRVPSMPVPDRN